MTESTASTDGDHRAAERRAVVPPAVEDRRQLLLELLHDRAQEPEWSPLSPPQQRLWLIDQLHPGTAAYNISVGFTLTGGLDLAMLRRSLQAITDRHGSLRTVFALRDGTPWQVIHPPRPVELRVVDLSDRPNDQVASEAYTCASAECAQPFDLEAGPLYRFTLILLGEQRHIFVCVMHHIISDGWSMGLLVDEFARNYRAISRGIPPPTAALPIQYADFARWQVERLQSGGLHAQSGYWKAKLAGAPATSDLPSDRPRPSQPSSVGSSHIAALPAELIERLRRVGRAHQATLFMVTLAAFNVVLWTLSGQEDVLVGTPVAGRERWELEEIIGFFVNTIIVRTDLSGEPRFADVLRQVRATVLEAFAHQDLPFEQLVATLNPVRAPGRNPLFQVLFASFKAAVQSQDFGDVVAAPYVVHTTSSRFDLAVNLIEGAGERWWVEVEYNTDLFDHERIVQVLTQYLNTLSSVADDSGQRITRLQLPQQGCSSRIGRSGHVLEDMPRTGSSHRHELVPPRDDIERVLTTLWERTLGVSVTGVTTSFFDLGGDSLLAVKLLAEARKAFGRRLPVSTIFHEPTIEHMAKQLRGEINSAAALIPLCATGSAPPLFVGGTDQRYIDVSRALGPDQPFYTMDVYALQESRLLSGKPLYGRLEDIAAHFLRDIIALDPHGPYHLAGYCHGGPMALEVALQLQAAGKEVRTLMIWDAPIAGLFRHRWPHAALHALCLALYGNLFSRLKMRRKIRKAGKRARQAELLEIHSETQKFLHIWAVIWRAFAAYKRRRRFKGRIIYLRAEEQPWHVQEVTAGWDEMASEGLVICPVPGSHSSIFDEHIGAFASAIHRFLTSGI